MNGFHCIHPFLSLEQTFDIMNLKTHCQTIECDWKKIYPIFVPNLPAGRGLYPADINEENIKLSLAGGRLKIYRQIIS
jgi:hypothetical protein